MDKNLSKYMALLKTVDTGSFTRAAEALNYSQSGISRMIADLEKEWQVYLLDRTAVPLSLTPEGQQLLPYVKALIADYDDLQDEVQRLHGVESGHIRIGTFTSVAIHWLPALIQRFQADYPGINYEIMLGDYPEVEQWLNEGSVDCGFLRLPYEGNFDYIPLGHDHLIAVLPPNHPLSKGETVSLKAMSREPLLLWQKEGKTSEVTVLFEANGLTPNVRFTTYDDYVIMAMVESGIGVSIMPQLVLERSPYQLVTRELDTTLTRQIVLATKATRRQSPAVERFITYLQTAQERLGRKVPAPGDNCKSGSRLL